MAYLLTIIGQYSPINKNICKFLLCVVLTVLQSNRKYSFVSAFSVYEHGLLETSAKVTTKETVNRMGLISKLSWSPL